MDENLLLSLYFVAGDSESDKSDDSDMEDVQEVKAPGGAKNAVAADKMSSSDEEDSSVPKVKVGGREYAVTDITEEVIAQMSPEEVEKYTQTYQDYYAHMYE